MGIPDPFTCLLRNLYLGKEATVRTGHETDLFQIGEAVHYCILSPCLFNSYAEYIMRNTGLEETQAGIKIAGRNIYNLRYVDDTTLMAKSEEELNSLLMKVKVESKSVGLKLNIQKNKFMASGFIISWQIDWETMKTVRDFIFSSVQLSLSVMSDSLQPHESQHARPPCPSPTPEFTQTHIHRVRDAIQPSHPLSSPSPPAPNPSQHQSLSQ